MANAPRKKVTRLVLVAALALAALLAEALIFTSLDHDCCGEGCPVCAQIEAAQRLLEGLGRAAGIVFAVGLLALCAHPPAKRAAVFFAPHRTPVFLKTKITC